MKRKILSMILGTAIAASLLTGCGGSQEAAATTAAAAADTTAAAADSSAAADAATEAAKALPCLHSHPSAGLTTVPT